MFPVVYDEIHTDGYPSLGCVGAKRLLSWQNDKHWLTIKQGLLGLQAVADLQDASTNDFRAPCVFAVGVLPPHRPQQQGNCDPLQRRKGWSFPGTCLSR